MSLDQVLRDQPVTEPWAGSKATQGASWGPCVPPSKLAELEQVRVTLAFRRLSANQRAGLEAQKKPLLDESSLGEAKARKKL